MPIISFGTQVVKTFAANAVKPSKISVGSTVVWQNVIPVGMDKSGSFLGTRNSFTKVPGWIVRSGYPDTVIQDDSLKVLTDGNVNIFTQVTWGDVRAGNQFRVLRNGIVLNTGTVGSTPTINVNALNVAASVNDLITVEAISDSFGSADRTVVSAYVYLEAA